MHPILHILAKDIENEDFDLDNETQHIVQQVGWERVLEESYHILSTDKYKHLWYEATSIFWFAVLDKAHISIPTNQIIARLYWCLDKYDDLGNTEYGYNLVWSIATKLKGISYNSDWEVSKDNEIQTIMKSFENIL